MNGLKYRLKDSLGRLLPQRFNTEKAALGYKMLMGRPDWKIVELKGNSYGY